MGRVIKADLHNHFTTLSKVLYPEKVAVKVRETLGPGGLCALVNYKDCRYEAFAKKAEKVQSAINLGNAIYFKDFDVVVAKGEEYPTAHGDLLILGSPEGFHLDYDLFNKEISIKGFDYCSQRSADIGCTNVLPHMFLKSEMGKLMTDENQEYGKYYVRDLHAIETHNGNAIFFNTPARKVYASLTDNLGMKIGQLSSTDGHSFREVGMCYTELDFPEYSELKSAEDFQMALRNAVINSRNPERLHKRNSYIGFAKHAGAIVSIKLLRKARINPHFGDKEALCG